MLAKIVAPGVIEIMGGQTASPLFRLQTLHGVLFLVLSLLMLALIRRQRRPPPDQKLKSVLPGLLILVPWTLFLAISLIAGDKESPGAKPFGQRLIRMDAARATLLFSESPRIPDIPLPLDWAQSARIQHNGETRHRQPDPDRTEEDQVFRHYLDLSGGLEIYLGETRFTTRTFKPKITLGDLELASNAYSVPSADWEKQKSETRALLGTLSPALSIPLITTEAFSTEPAPERMETLRPRSAIPESLVEMARGSLKELEQGNSKTWCWNPPSSWRLALFLLCAATSLISILIVAIVRGWKMRGVASIPWKLTLPGAVLGGLLLTLAWDQGMKSRIKTCVSTAGDQISTWQQARPLTQNRWGDRPEETRESLVSYAKREIKVLHHSADSGYFYLGATKSGKLSQLTPVEADQSGIFLTLQGLPLEQDISLWLMIQASLNEN